MNRGEWGAVREVLFPVILGILVATILYLQL